MGYTHTSVVDESTMRVSLTFLFLILCFLCILHLSTAPGGKKKKHGPKKHGGGPKHGGPKHGGPKKRGKHDHRKKDKEDEDEDEGGEPPVIVIKTQRPPTARPPTSARIRCNNGRRCRAP